MSQPRHKRKRKRSLIERDGQQVRVSRLTSQGVMEYDAILRVETNGQGELGRVYLERIKLIYSFARLGDFTLFKAAVDLPIPGLRDWWMISGIPVEISEHTNRHSYTRMVMDLLGYAA